MKLLLIADIHHGKNCNYEHIGGADYVNTFGSTLQDNIGKLKEVAQEVDAIVNLGDLIREENNLEVDMKLFQEGKELLESLGKPVYHVGGNHDYNPPLGKESIQEITGYKNMYYSFDGGGYTHIVLDADRDVPEGEKEFWKFPYTFSDEQILWLENTLTESTQKCIIYCHYPIDDQDISKNPYWPTGNTAKVFPQNYELVRNILEKSGKVKAYFNGHTHFGHSVDINNITYTTLGSFSENNTQGQPSKQYAILELLKDKISVENKKL